jgi:hypothetical protein
LRLDESSNKSNKQQLPNEKFEDIPLRSSLRAINTTDNQVNLSFKNNQQIQEKIQQAYNNNTNYNNSVNHIRKIGKKYLNSKSNDNIVANLSFLNEQNQQNKHAFLSNYKNYGNRNSDNYTTRYCSILTNISNPDTADNSNRNSYQMTDSTNIGVNLNPKIGMSKPIFSHDSLITSTLLYLRSY